MAAIITTQGLVDNINDIMNPISMPDVIPGNSMDTTETNLFFNALESILNRLYEKCRELEDLHDFAQSYIQKEFSKSKKALDHAVDMINLQSDDYAKSSAYMAMAQFGNASVQHDRDGTPLHSAEIGQRAFLLPYSKLVTKAEIGNCIVSSGQMPYRTIKSPPEQYRAFYLLERPETAWNEAVTMLFKKPVEINFAHIPVFGCQKGTVSLIRTDDAKFSIDSLTVPVQEVKGIEISLLPGISQPADLAISIPRDTDSDIRDIYEDELKESIFDTYTGRRGTTINVYQSVNE